MGRGLYGFVAVILAVFLLATPFAEARSIDGYRHGGMCNSKAAARHITMMEHIFKPDPGRVLEQMSNLHADSGTWLQIGANTLDPVQNANDPFMHYLSKFPSWRKIFVEPIPLLFAKLEQAVKTWPNSTAINNALSTRKDISEESVSMYCLEGATSTAMDGGLPSWANQICSFDPGHVTRHFPGAKAQEVKVKAVSFKHLVSKNSISNVKVLLVDTEGFDLHVLEQVPFHKIRPQLVLWEHKHMSVEDRAAAWALMRSQCYGVWEVDGENTIALSMTY
jgi:FkbM family methyltransferase